MLIYSLTLAQVSLLLGIFYLLTHAIPLWKFEPSKNFLLKIHRNDKLGVGIFTIATLWAIYLIGTMDLMEYTPYRHIFVLVVFVIAGLTVYYLRDYIAVRAIGILLLLFANVMLDAAFLRDEPAKYVITILAYLMIIKGMFLVSMPYLFRDFIQWFYAKPQRAKISLMLGSLAGLALILLGVLVY
jgi:hypothetical protein